MADRGVAEAADPLQFGDSSYDALARTLSRYDARVVVACLGGMLTIPEYQPQTLRIEVLLHLACLHCRGKKKPGSEDFRRWLETVLGDHPVKRLEDPPEDVFVSNVTAPGGNYRIFEGMWYTSDLYLQDVITCVFRSPSAHRYRALQSEILALLTLAEAVAERARLPRWTRSPSSEAGRNFLAKPDLAELMRRVTFADADLAYMGISPNVLKPFLLSQETREALASERWGHSSLERHPLLPETNGVVFACPTAVGATIRRYALEWMTERGYMMEFWHALRILQRDAAFEGALNHLAQSGPRFDALPESPPVKGWLPLSADVAVCPTDTNKLAHLVVIHDNLWEIPDAGLTSNVPLGDDTAEPLHVYLGRAARELGEKTDGGLSILIVAGLGRGLSMPRPNLPPKWQFVHFTLPDFVMFGWAKGASLLRLWKLYERATEIRAQGVRLQNLSGALNLLEFWQDLGYSLIPKDFAYPARIGFMGLPTDSIQDFRERERIRNDVHAVVAQEGRRYTTVRRLVRDSYFKGLAMRPIYVADRRAQNGELDGVVEGSHCIVWVHATRPEGFDDAAGFLYQVWEGLLEWVDRAIPAFERSISPAAKRVAHVNVSFQDLAEWAAMAQSGGMVTAHAPTITPDRSSATVLVEIPFGFTAYLARPTNDGERLLLEGVVEALLHLWSGESALGEQADLRTVARQIVAVTMPSQHARSIHLFDAPDPTYHIGTGDKPEPRFVQPEDRAAWMTGLAWRVLSQPNDGAPLVIDGKARATQLLKQLVDSLWGEIRARLQTLNGPSLVRMTLTNNEEVIRDRKWWRQTARALSALYGENENVEAIAGEQEHERALAMHAGRILTEMAVPTCPAEGGRVTSHSDFDALLAAVATLLDLASDSDAIHGGLTEGVLHVHPSGTVESDRARMIGVANPYAIELHATGFREAVETYERLYERRADTPAPEDEPAYGSPEFVSAFRAEYGISPSQLLEAMAELIDLAIESGTRVTETTRGNISERLQSNREFSKEEADALLSFFTLWPRKRWDAAPKGFTNRDWFPWKYRRRLSLVARPIVAFGGEPNASVFYGVDQIALSTAYLLEGIQNAFLPNEFFSSAEMQRFRGSVAQELGHAFEETVADELRGGGWEARVSVQMKSIGAPPELGDVDVIAWHPSDRRLLLIECKRLQTARGIGEIVERLNQFRGDTQDRLGRHLRRCEWIEAHLSAVLKQLSMRHLPTVVTPILVTNVEVPMQFERGLPLPPNRILPVRSIRERIVPGHAGAVSLNSANESPLHEE